MDLNGTSFLQSRIELEQLLINRTHCKLTDAGKLPEKMVDWGRENRPRDPALKYLIQCRPEQFYGRTRVILADEPFVQPIE